MAVISVDFNNLVRGGQVLGSTNNASGFLAPGHLVTVKDHYEEGMIFEATVAAVEGSRVYLHMHWEPAP